MVVAAKLSVLDVDRAIEELTERIDSLKSNIRTVTFHKAYKFSTVLTPDECTPKRWTDMVESAAADKVVGVFFTEQFSNDARAKCIAARMGYFYRQGKSYGMDTEAVMHL